MELAPGLLLPLSLFLGLGSRLEAAPRAGSRLTTGGWLQLAARLQAQ